MSGSYVNRLIAEIASYERTRGKRPKYIILGKWKDAFYSELADYVLKTDGEKFENPIDGHRQFHGIVLINAQVCYGSSDTPLFILGD